MQRGKEVQRMINWRPFALTPSPHGRKTERRDESKELEVKNWEGIGRQMATTGTRLIAEGVGKEKKTRGGRFEGEEEERLTPRNSFVDPG